MYLKQLTLKGFKSFADTTVLDLQPGVTVVVGPNGSGKSNIVDAVAWVLGAQAPSAMRSQRMDDVIFGGTDKRSALGRAQVSLSLDNSSGMLPVEFSEVTVTRTLFRSGDSEYAINDVPCRLLDVQDLLSASGVGRQQHVIVSQGQIDAVLNARPEDRRLVIEEAAGVLTYRKRKERSERRLLATEGSLTRLQDLLREVRRQLRPLERQADAARRHGAVVAELTALRIFVAGRELSTLRQKLEALNGTRSSLADDESGLLARLGALDAIVMQTEARLTAMGGDDLGDDLAQFESLYERARGQVALLAEQRRGIDRDRASSIDQGVVASLEADASRLATELASVETDLAALHPDRGRLAELEHDLDRTRAAFEQAWADGVPAPSGRAAEVRGELAARRGSEQRSNAELERVAARLAALGDRAESLAQQADALRSQLADAEQAELPLVEALERAEADRAAAEEVLAATQAALQDAGDNQRAWEARAEALSLALDEARARAGAEHLAAVDGVLGALVELVEVDDGWEQAFEAAAGEALAAVVVDGEPSARRALAALDAAALSGAVLAGGAAMSGGGHTPVVGEPLRDHVRSDIPAVGGLLDALLAGVGVVDSPDAAMDACVANPTALVVTRRGDRFAPSGWRLGASGTGATGAALREATDSLAVAVAEVQRCEAAVTSADAAVGDARSVERDLSAQLDDNDARMTAAADGLQRVESDRRDATSESEGLRAHLDELTERTNRERTLVAELEASLPDLEAEESDLAEKSRVMAQAREALDVQSAEAAALRTDIDMRSVSLVERQEFLAGRLAEVDQRLERSAAEREQARERRIELDRQAEALDGLAAIAADVEQVAGDRLADLRERRRRQSEAAREVASELDGHRKERTGVERQLSEVRERLQRIDVEAAEVRLRIEAATEALRRDLDCEPDVAMAAAQPELAEGVTPTGRVRELERDLRLMGPINPLALEEFEALSERHGFLQDQLDDVKETRRELNKVIRAIDEEIINVFAAAYADVSQNFERLFATLFPGGVGKLRLTDPEDLLNTGLEVEAKPSGKNVKKLSLLSGGERSLAALAFLFSVFRSRPSPFYVMDEVEAALDDVNLHRFLGLIDEFRHEAQFIVVSHQKRTMESADCLYGVTMQPGGSSRVVSERSGAEVGG